MLVMCEFITPEVTHEYTVYSSLHIVHFTYIGGDLGGNNLVAVVPKVKVQMRKKESLATSDLAHEEILVRRVANVSPHWKIFDKHLKKVIIVDGILELFKLSLVKRRLTQETPVNGIQKRYFVGRGLTPVPYNGFAKTLSMALGAETLFAPGARVQLQVYILFCSSSLLFLFSRVLVTEGERVVTVGFGRIIERSVRSKKGTVIEF
jgi:hypothetical protein